MPSSNVHSLWDNFVKWTIHQGTLGKMHHLSWEPFVKRTLFRGTTLSNEQFTRGPLCPMYHSLHSSGHCLIKSTLHFAPGGFTLLNIPFIGVFFTAYRRLSLIDYLRPPHSSSFLWVNNIIWQWMHDPYERCADLRGRSSLTGCVRILEGGWAGGGLCTSGCLVTRCTPICNQLYQHDYCLWNIIKELITKHY